MYDVFISYRRNGGEHTAKIIRDRLSELGYNVFFDVESLRSGNFNEKLYSVIDECRDFILILSPGALDRCINRDDWVRKEIEHAMSQNKNIIPVMLRDFTFDCQLPESMKSLPFLNGIEANSQFFEAFIQKLQQFMKSKPSFVQRLKESVLLKKTLPLIIAVAVIFFAAVGIKTWYDSAHRLYPSTKAEINLLKEVVYSVSTDLTKLDIMAGAEENAYNAALRYLQSETKDTDILQRELNVSKDKIESIEKTEIRTDLLSRLQDTPYVVADIVAMSDAVVTYKNDSIDNIEYIEFVIGPESVYTNEERLQVVECYRDVAREYMKIYSYCTNEMFLHITNKQALSEMFEIILPVLVNIPLSQAGWLDNKSAIDSATNEAYNRIESITMEIATLVGNSAAELNEMKNELKQKQKQQKLSGMEEYKNKIKELCIPLQSDSADTLWVKMTHLLYCDFYDEANLCIDMFEQTTDDAYSTVYLAALRKYAERVKVSGEKGGIMVADYEFPDSPDNVLLAGDIIVSFNGQPCLNGQQYSQYKDLLSSNTYTVGVLRLNDSGQLQEKALTIKNGGPRVLMYDIMYSPELQ